MFQTNYGNLNRSPIKVIGEDPNLTSVSTSTFSSGYGTYFMATVVAVSGAGIVIMLAVDCYYASRNRSKIYSKPVYCFWFLSRIFGAS